MQNSKSHQLETFKKEYELNGIYHFIKYLPLAKSERLNYTSIRPALIKCYEQIVADYQAKAILNLPLIDELVQELECFLADKDSIIQYNKDFNDHLSSPLLQLCAREAFALKESIVSMKGKICDENIKTLFYVPQMFLTDTKRRETHSAFVDFLADHHLVFANYLTVFYSEEMKEKIYGRTYINVQPKNGNVITERWRSLGGRETVVSEVMSVAAISAYALLKDHLPGCFVKIAKYLAPVKLPKLSNNDLDAHRRGLIQKAFVKYYFSYDHIKIHNIKNILYIFRNPDDDFISLITCDALHELVAHIVSLCVVGKIIFNKQSPDDCLADCRKLIKNIQEDRDFHGGVDSRIPEIIDIADGVWAIGKVFDLTDKDIHLDSFKWCTDFAYIAKMSGR